MVQAGSVFSVASKPAMARPNSKEWSRATARSNEVCASAEHDVTKCTVPSFSAADPCSWSCADTSDASMRDRTPPTTTDHRIIDLPPAGSPSEADGRPQQRAEQHADDNQRRHRRREVRIHHERETGDHLRPAQLFLSVDQQDESDAAGNQRQKEPERIQRHQESDRPNSPTNAR